VNRAIARSVLLVRRSVGCQAQLGLVAVGSVDRSVLAVGVSMCGNLVGRGHGGPGLPASCRSMIGGRFGYQRSRSGRRAVFTLVLVMMMWRWVLCRVVVVAVFGFDKVPWNGDGWIRCVVDPHCGE